MKNLYTTEEIRKEIEELNWAISRADEGDEVKTIMEIKRDKLKVKLENKINKIKRSFKNEK